MRPWRNDFTRTPPPVSALKFALRLKRITTSCALPIGTALPLAAELAARNSFTVKA